MPKLVLIDDEISRLKDEFGYFKKIETGAINFNFPTFFSNEVQSKSTTLFLSSSYKDLFYDGLGSETGTRLIPSSEAVAGLTPSSQGVAGLTPSSQGVAGLTPSSQGVAGLTPSSQGVSQFAPPLHGILSFNDYFEKSSSDKKPRTLESLLLVDSSFYQESDILLKWVNFPFENVPLESSIWQNFISKFKPKISVKKPLIPVLHQIGIDDIISFLHEKFTISDEEELTNFILKTSINLIADFHIKLQTIANLAVDFFKKENIQIVGTIEKFEDDEIKDFESISMSFRTKNVDSDKCFSLTEKLVSEIAKIEPDSLKYLQIEIIPNEH